MKIELTLKEDDYNYLVAILERYLEKLTEAGEIREVAKLVEKIDNDYKEVED